jgi:threonine dehydrogenase-like Zn-dependent dehydrogenase
MDMFFLFQSLNRLDVLVLYMSGFCGSRLTYLMKHMIGAGQIWLKMLITHILPLEHYQDGFALVKSQQTIKVQLKP